MPKLIISYRRSDSRDIAGRIRDRLVGRYGADTGSVYMDIDDIPPGIDFRQHINQALSAGDILLPIIGPKWLGPTRGKKFRINDPSDPVRVEIETALERKLIIVPVLVDDATMPTAEELPDSIKDLAYRNAVTVDGGKDFHLHMNRLVDGLDKLRPPTRFPKVKAVRSKPWLLPAGVATAAALTAVVWFAYPLMRGSPGRGGEGGPYIPAPTDRTWPAPADRSYWLADNSLLYLEASGSARELIFADPTKELVKLGARPGDLLFEGRKDGDRYEGRGYHYLGACPDRRVIYEASGPIIQNLTIELVGKVPRMDLATCKQARAVDDQLLFDDKSVVVKFKYKK